MKVKMYPALDPNKEGTSGIDRVVEAYYRHLPDFGVTFVSHEADSYDLIAGHVGQGYQAPGPFVNHTHGLHWSADHQCNQWQWQVNAHVINACRHATEITVPSAWVAESFQRDMRLTPHIIPHGIDWQAWQHNEPLGDYALWNKNRSWDVCDPMPVLELARRFDSGHFMTTFLPQGVPVPNNTHVTGLIPHSQMKMLVQSALVYLSTTKETFGIGVLEAMAGGVPVLGYAHGGNVGLVQHGVNGYLAAPGDIDDLAEGLNFCVQHRAVLGANGRELAKEWTWQRACEQVAAVYQKALAPDPPTVAVVIPVFNKSEDEIRRAIESAINQTHKTAIIIVDDGSSDKASVERIVNSYLSKENDIELLQQNNNGVAVARNRGIMRAADQKYICCLDPDDYIGPRFVETCVEELEGDRSLGIVYTPLRYYKPDGMSGISPWPDDWDFDKQLQRQNQVPTCCVFRREMWERLGGYRQRYAPQGCGAEDAELWTRAGAYGWRAKMAEPFREVVDMHRHVSHHFQRETTRDEVIARGILPEKYDQVFDSFFHYSWQSGMVTGNPDYEEVDWLAWHPWVKDGQHPFASYATPAHHSHPVRQYDEPAVSVIIPVGPGHEKEVTNALDSLEAQTFRKWEVVVVWDTNHHLNLDDGSTPNKPEFDALRKAYPYIRWVFTADSGSGTYGQGAGYARNRGAEIARAPFLVFLDADDWLHPQALEKMLAAWRETKEIVYTDYMNRSWITSEYLAQIERSGRFVGVIKERMEEGKKKHLAVYWSKAYDYDCEKAQRQPELDPHTGQFYFWCLITTLIPKAWHDELGGFDESMSSFEDLDYYWRLARAGRCFHRVPEQLVVYNYHTGHRREQGLQDHQNLIQYLREKYERMPMAGCSGCGGSRRRQLNSSRSTFARSNRAAAAQALSDDDFVDCRYIHPRGSINKHQVTGGALFRERLPMKMRNKGTGWSIDYGSLQHGDIVPVHVADIEAMPGQWVRIQRTIASTAPPIERKPMDAPKPINGGMGQEAPPAPGLIPAAEMPFEPAAIDRILEEKPTSKTFGLQQLPGIGKAIADQMIADGIESKEQVLALGVDGLMKYRGVSDRKAAIIIRALSEK